MENLGWRSPDALLLEAEREESAADIAELVSVLRDLNGYYLGVPYPLLDRIKAILSKHEARDDG